MNWFALFAVLLIVTPAPVPVPRQTPNGAAHAHSKPDDKAYKGKPPSTPTLAIGPVLCGLSGTTLESTMTLRTTKGTKGKRKKEG